MKVRTRQQNNYYHSIVIPRITEYFNGSKKKWYFIKLWDNKKTHEWFKRFYFGGSSKDIDSKKWEEIMSKIRTDFSMFVWIPQPNEEDLFF